MEGKAKSRRTSERLDWPSITSYKKRCSRIPFTKIGRIAYRCLVAVGVVCVIYVLISLHQNQLLLEAILTKGLLHPLVSRNRTCQCTTETASVGLNGTVIIQREDHSAYPHTEASPTARLPHEEFKEFVVYNPSCEIPDYPKFHNDVKPFYRKMRPTICSRKPLLTSVYRSGNNPSYVLTLHKTYLPQYVDNGSVPVCCYSIINTNNTNYAVGECQIFETNTTLTPNADLVHVNCKDDRNITFYRINHFLVPIKDEVHKKMERFHVDHNNSEEFLSVMIVGLDSVSRLNLLRTMPATVDYMERNSWYSFPPYHRIQWNTFHNLNGPVLTGHLGRQLKDTCWPDESNHLDTCPYIWKNFSERNYITAYGEDAPKMDSFTYQAFNGFKQQPTDYYLKPHMTATEIIVGKMPPEKWWAIPKCIGPIRAADYILDFASDFASSFVNYPTFSLFWLNIAHEQVSAPQILDGRFVEYFGNLNNSGALNRTMVVFMSDHGLRRTNFRSTYMGFVEAAMPFLYIWLPKWFRDKYPDKIENLERNKFRLTSHFDLHLTLMDVLGVSATATGCPKCVSLFERVPWNRSCSDAGISIDSCACDNFLEIPVDSTTKQLAECAAARINTLAASHAKYLQKGYKCSVIRVSSIVSARREVFKTHEFGQKYVINLVTAPNYATIEAVVMGDTHEVKSITDYSHYRERSFCMNSREGKKWCTCDPPPTKESQIKSARL